MARPDATRTSATASGPVGRARPGPERRAGYGNGRPWAAYAGCGVAAIVLSLALSETGKLATLSLVQFSGGVAVFAALWWHRPASRAGWLSLGVGSLLLGAGAASWLIYVEILHQPIPYPGWSDALFVPGYLALIVGLLAMIRKRSPAREASAMLDGLIWAVVLAFANWVFLTGPATHAELTGGQRVITVVYPFIDVMLVALVARLLFTAGRSSPSLWLLTTGAVVMFGGDAAYAVLSRSGGYHVGDLPDQLWMASLVLVGAAALHPSMRGVAVEVENQRGGTTRLRLAALIGALQIPAVVLLVALVVGEAVSTTAILIVCCSLGLLVAMRVALLATTLRRLALADPLTGLASRETLIAQLDRGAPGARSNPGRAALLYIDVDHFKMVNDTLGHEAGDRLLVEVSNRLRSLVREPDCLARLSGDEFVILFEGLSSPAEAEGLAERVVIGLATPFRLDGTELCLSASVGLVDLDGTDGVTALRNADIAMYAAKTSGRSCWMRFTRSMHEALVEGVAIDTDLRRAIDRDELLLHYQPIVDLASGRLNGVEALVRWQHPKRGLLSPAAFVPAAERSGMIVELGAWVLRSACRQLAAWQTLRPGGTPLTMSVNVSARQLSTPGFVQVVEEALAGSSIDPARLCLELTESALLTSTDGARAIVAELGRLGVAIALDDFGTCYASLTYLQQLAVDIVKIDKSFVDGLGVKLEETTIVAAVIGLAKAMRLTIVAEGVETAEQLLLLRDMGCDDAQGFHLGRPAPADQLTDRLDTDWCGPSWAQSEPISGRGSEVRPMLRALPTAGGKHRYRVVLADDDENDRFLLRRELEATGRFDVVSEAEDGTMAVRLAALHQPHLVVLDLRMPNVDGLSALPRLLVAAPGTKVVFVSGYASPGSVDRALAIGAAAFHKKGVPNLAAELLALFEPDPSPDQWREDHAVGYGPSPRSHRSAVDPARVPRPRRG